MDGVDPLPEEENPILLNYSSLLQAMKRIQKSINLLFNDFELKKNFKP